MKTFLGFALAFGIGIGCRMTDIPVPAPHVLLGAVLVLCITLGYVAMDRCLGGDGAGKE